MNEKNLVEQIRVACSSGAEVLSLSVLCESIGSIGLRDPNVLPVGSSIADCIGVLQKNKVGSVLLVDEDDCIKGIFTERDLVLKVVGKVASFDLPIDSVMTKDPVCERPETTVAYALNLMSHGGFRHLPIVDQDMMPIGILSVKDVVDYLVGKMMEGLLDIPLGPTPSSQ